MPEIFDSMTYQNYVSRLSSQDEAACEAEAVQLGQQADAGLELLQALSGEADPDLRFWAVRGLWANGSEVAIKILITLLADEDEMVRSGAALALGELKAAAAVEALSHLLATDPGTSGDHASDALSKIGPASASVLITALGHAEAWVRRRAARALIPVESRSAITPLFHALDDESYMVRYYAEEALARMGVGQMVYFQV